MASLTSAKQALRVSTTSMLRPLTLAPAAGRVARRMFHESTNQKAVESAVGPNTPAFQEPPPPAPFSGMRPARPQAATAAPVLRPVFPQQLNVLEQAHKSEFYLTVAEIVKLRERYVEDRAIFVEGKEMMRLMKGLGAREEDIPGFENSGELLVGDPTLPFRKARNGRFCFDLGTQSVRRMEFQPFVLTAEEDFKRYDSGQVRRFDEILNNLQLNSFLQALFIFKVMIIHGVNIAHRPGLDYNASKWVCTLFATRTITTPEILGEPALEGVHSDGVDHTMTTFLRTRNMGPNSAATFLHGMGETTGIPNKNLNPDHLVGRVQHKNLLDTLVIADHERKHSLSPVLAIDPSVEAQRDMLIFFTRRPVHSDHVSGGIDSLVAHEELPMEVPLFVPPYTSSQ